MKNQEFLMLSVDEVAKLLASDDLNVPSEELIFHVSGTNLVLRKYHNLYKNVLFITMTD